MAEVSLYPGALDSSNIYEVVARLSTTLTADITAATTTIPLASTTGFPTKGYIVIDNETMQYISVAVGSVDCTGGRGHAGTAASHTNTTQVLVAVTAAVFNKLRAGLIAVQTYIGISGSTSSDFITNHIATGAEVTAGADNTKIVTPQALGNAGIVDGKINNVSFYKTTFDIAYNGGSAGVILPYFATYSAGFLIIGGIINDVGYVSGIYLIAGGNTVTTVTAITNVVVGFTTSTKTVAITNNKAGSSNNFIGSIIAITT